MSRIIKLEKHETACAMSLFKEVGMGWDVMVEGARDFGFILADDRQLPNVALAYIGGCIVYGGDAFHQNARALVESMQVQPGVFPFPSAWAALVQEVFGDKVKREERFFLPLSSLSYTKLSSVNTELSPGFELKRIDMNIAHHLKEQIGEEYHIHHYLSLEDFVDRGCGFCICQGDEILASAIASIRLEKAIQIQINTVTKYRRQGLAAKVGAALLKHCIENGIRADWDAGNPGSRDLAFKLGYTDCIPYKILSILPD